jgi:glycosyltransferase involved in cell wall biosynthesis
VHYGAAAERICRYPFTSVREDYVEDEPAAESEKEALRQKIGITEDKVVVSVGQFIHRKGFDVLIAAAAEFGKDVGVYIIGGKPAEEYLELQRKYGAGNIHYIEFMGAPELKEYYKAADLFVLPTREDIWGLVINEAMANGLPVVTTNQCVAGLELVEDSENGFIVPADDAEQLAEKIKIILGDNELRKKMANQSLKKIRTYTIENMANEHRKAFEKRLP